jgi:hypothetical protein
MINLQNQPISVTLNWVPWAHRPGEDGLKLEQVLPPYSIIKGIMNNAQQWSNEDILEDIC